MFRAGTVGTLVLLAFGAPACSFMFVEPLPASHQPGDLPTCTSDPTAPIVDTGFALAYLGSTVYIGTRQDVSNKAPAVALGIVDAAVTLSSAIYGYVNTAACRAAKRESEAPPPFRGLGRGFPAGYPTPTPVPASPPVGRGD
jgi:hypothetical protein